MHLKLESLQQIVRQVTDEEHAAAALRTEVTRVLGPSVITEQHIIDVAREANERIDVLEHTGRSLNTNFKPSVLMKIAGHRAPEVRKLAARMLPVRLAQRFCDDKNPSVRLAVAKRLPTTSVKEMVKRFPLDDSLRLVLKKKRLAEAGLPTPKKSEEQPNMYGEDRLGDSARTFDQELSDQWYDTAAYKIIQDYGHDNFEGQWEELAVKVFCRNTKSTSGVEVDSDKLYKKVVEQLKDRDDRVLERDALKETLDVMNSSMQRMDEFVEEADPVKSLVVQHLGNEEYIKQANRVFAIKGTQVPSSIKKYRLGESNLRDAKVPVVGTLPHQHGFRAVDERALDMYCECWNKRQEMSSSEPMKIEWYTHPSELGKVGFTTYLK